jgi:multidrug efflux pump
LIGIFLLIGIVKKNAIMMIDFALKLTREGSAPGSDLSGMSVALPSHPDDDDGRALGGLPGGPTSGTGSELPIRSESRLLAVDSQSLRPHATPVVYLAFDRLARRLRVTRLAIRWKKGHRRLAMNISAPR